MVNLSWWKRWLSRECSGEGKGISNERIVEIDPAAEEANYLGTCPECGKQRPCTGYGVVLAHGK